MDENLNLEGNLEIEKALKEFEAKNSTQTAQVPSAPGNPENSKMVQFVIKYSGGYIKDQRQAEYVLLGFAIISIIISFFLFFGGNITQENESPIYQEDLTPTARETLPKEVLDTIPYKNGK